MNEDAAQLSDIGTYFGNILSAMMPLLGILAFGALLFGGFQVLTAGADTKAAGQGKSTMTAAAVGIVFALGAWLVLSVIENITGAQVTQFKLSF